MDLAALDPAVIALIGTLCGGVGLKVTEWALTRGKTQVEDARHIREELRLQVTSQKEDIDSLEEERDNWKEKYYDLRDQHVAVQTELTLALQKIKKEAETQIDTIDNLKEQDNR